MSATWTSPGWCPPAVEGQPRYRWAISYEPVANDWAPQEELIGGPPTGVDLEALLKHWFHERGGPAARWRLRVTPLEDETTVLAAVVLHFAEAVERKVKRLGPDRGPIAQTFYTSSRLLPPSPAQLRAWETRPEGPPEAWKARPAAPDVRDGSATSR
jgi:hypothetical protein